MHFVDLGTMSWADAWRKQLDAHANVARGGEETVFFVEHTPVVTLGRQKDLSLRNLVYPVEQLVESGIEVVETDRGGNVTFHGPGQLVCYPILSLARHRLTVGGYVRLLQQAAIDTLARCPLKAEVDPSAVGVWTLDAYTGELAKICSIGVRVRRGVTLHGLALNVSVDLDYFRLIVPCGLEGRAVTSVRRVLGVRATDISHLRWFLKQSLSRLLDEEQVMTLD
jgi:lipoyl(octanoyl) transferase